MMICWLFSCSYQKQVQRDFVDTVLAISSVLLPVAYVASIGACRPWKLQGIWFSFITGSALIARYLNSQADQNSYVFASTIIIFLFFFPSGITSYPIPEYKILVTLCAIIISVMVTVHTGCVCRFSYLKTMT